MNTLFFRVGKLRTRSIDETDYKSIIMDLFAQFCDVDVDPSNIKLIQFRDDITGEVNGFKSFSFVKLDDSVDVNEVITKIDGQTTADGYELNASIAEDKPKNDGFKKNFRSNN